jgi:parvulin-like peptidyl-prolyl isomerase
MFAWVAGAQIAPPAAPAARTPAAAPPPAIATVGELRIPQAELDQRAQQALAEYKGRTGSDLPAEVVPIARRQMLESLIRRDLLILEARRRGMLATAEAAEVELKRDPYFQTNGRFDQARFDQVRLQHPDAVATAIQGLRVSLAARDLLAKLQAEKGPDRNELRGRARRALTHASVEYLILRRAEFDGSYPEPHESEVLEYHRTHAAEFHRPARATLSVVFVDQPALSDSEAAIPSVAAAWNAQRRATADSILAAVKAGRTLAEASQSQGGPRPNQSVLLENFPGYWKGDAASRSAVFAAKPGTVLPEPVPALKGWLVVRVDDVQPEHVAPLREVARTIRTRLRDEGRRETEDRDLRGLYAALRDSLMVTAYRARYAVADTGVVDAGPVGAADLERYYRSHLADYSSFSGTAGGVVAKTLDEVRDDVRARLLRERRLERSHDLAAGLFDAWAHRRRDAAVEKRLGLRDVGPIVPGWPADTGSAGRVLGDTLSLRAGVLGPGLVRVPRGWMAFDVYQALPGQVLTFEQARDRLLKRRAQRRAQEDEQGARRLFDETPRRFAGGSVIHYTRAFVPVPSVLQVHLSRAEVMRYYREHLDQFTAPEMVRASHILISPRDATPAADHEARVRADSVLERLRAGEDFATLAKKVTDDPATADNGGDLGLFGRGAMLPEVERAAFALRAGDLTQQPVRSPVGYHLIKVHEYVPLVAQPLPHIYADLSAAAAEAKADSLAQARADSLMRILTSAPQGREAARRMGLVTLSYPHSAGEREAYPVELHPYYQQLETLKPGEVLPLKHQFGGMGWAITWVDSISPPATPTWEQGRARALEAYRSGAGERALEAKRAELDSLMHGGWSFDSVAVAWGGLQRVEDLTPGQRFPGIGSGGRVDTLVFGRNGDDGEPVGQLSDWITLPAGATRVRTVAIRAPEPNALTTRLENDSRMETDKALTGYFEELKKRYPVKILDRKLRDVMLPQPASR